jgi:predicted phospho-2-dehydro-3-deoxyheptonate aldolase
MNGKEIRLSRILPFPGSKGCIVPVDHGVTYGPIAGLEKCFKSIGKIIGGGASAIVLHKGILARISKHQGLVSGNYIMHISASTCLGSHQRDKVLVGTVEEAIRLGAVGVSLQVNLGAETEPAMLKDFGLISERCYAWGMPLLAMMYVVGDTKKVEQITHAARLAEELGADLVKLDYPGTAEGIRQIVSSVEIPVLIAGGSRIDKLEEFLRIVDESMFGGASGVSVGRNIFQHEQADLVTEVVCNLLQAKWHIEESLNYIDNHIYQVLR